MTSLREIVLSVRYGDAALVGESAGYLVLGVADLLSDMPRSASLDAISVSDDGSVAIDASPCTFQESEASLRHLLGLLLQLVRTPCKNLDRVAERKETRGIFGLVAELESALVPVNRKAARRSLARLVRESKKATAQMGALAHVEPVVPSAARVQASYQLPEVSPEAADDRFEELAPDEVHSEVPTRVAPRVLAAPVISAVAAPNVQSPKVRPVVHDLPRLSSAPVVGVQITGRHAPTFVEPTPSDEGASTRPTVRAPSIASDLALSLLAREYRSTTPWGATVVEPVVDENCVVGELGIRENHSGAEDAWAIEELRPIDLSPVVLPPLMSSDHDTPLIEYAAVHFEEVDPLDAAPTQIFPGAIEVDAITTVPPSMMRAAPEKVFENPVRPLSTRVRPPLADDVALVPRADLSTVRRPSDINELLNRMSISPEPDDELYAGLKMLSRVELSPLSPPVGVDWMSTKTKAC